MERHRFPCVFTDSPDYPSFADLTGDFAYARLMRSAMSEDTGYAPTALSAWAERAQRWAAGAEPADLPRIEQAEATPDDAIARDVFVYFISAAKARNPAAAMALMQRLRESDAKA